MALFKSKSATADSSVVTEQKLSLTATFEALDIQFQSVFVESQGISDAILDAPIQETLKGVAELIGFTEYSPEINTLYMSVRDGDKRMYGPSLKAYGNTACIVWGQKRILLDENESLNSAKFGLMQTEYGAVVVVDPTGYCMPVTVAFESQYVKADAFKSFKTKLLTLRTPGQLAQYLQRAEDLVKWSEVEDGQTVEFYSLNPAHDREDPSKIKYFVALAGIGDRPVRMYAPGDVEQWVGVKLEEPVTLTKQGSLITASNGMTFEIKGSFVKMAELEPGISYKVTGFTTKIGTYGLEVLLDVLRPNGEAIKVNGNALIKQRLGTAPADTITPERPAVLVVDSIGKTKAGHAKVNCRLMTSGDAESPMLKALKEQQAKLQAERQLANAGTVEPF